MMPTTVVGWSLNVSFLPTRPGSPPAMLPPFVAHDNDRAAALLIFLGLKRTAEERPHAERLKETRRHNPGTKRFRLAIAGEQVAPRFRHPERVERLALVDPIGEIGGRCLFPLDGALRRALPDRHDAVVLRIR
jgi:hypothetical protein